MTEFGYLQLDGWAGRTQQKVEVVGRTPKRVRVKALARTRLAGRRRSIEPGETALVPTHAVTAEPRPGVAVIEPQPRSAWRPGDPVLY